MMRPAIGTTPRRTMRLFSPRTAQRPVDPRGPMRPGGHGDANRRDNTCRGRRTPRWPAFSPWAILIYPATSLLKPFFDLIIVFFSWLHGKFWCDVVSDSVPKKWAWLLRSFLLCKGIWAHFLGLHFGTMQTLFFALLGLNKWRIGAFCDNSCKGLYLHSMMSNRCSPKSPWLLSQRDQDSCRSGYVFIAS